MVHSHSFLLQNVLEYFVGQHSPVQTVHICMIEQTSWNTCSTDFMFTHHLQQERLYYLKEIPMKLDSELLFSEEEKITEGGSPIPIALFKF